MKNIKDFLNKAFPDTKSKIIGIAFLVVILAAIIFFIFNLFLKNKTPEELVNICTCGAVNKNLKLKKKKEKIKDKIKEFERRETEEFIEHKKDCLLLKHNFVYHPSQEDEFWIDWYKYPFRDSYCNKDLSKKEILDIFQDCINQFLKKYNSQ